MRLNLIISCLFVGLVVGVKNPGWKDNSEYVYELRGRTFSSLHDVGDVYTGVLFKGEFRVRTGTDGKLYGKITNPQYAQIHSQLSNGWRMIIPDAEVNYKKLQITDKPFIIEMDNGVVRNLYVDDSVLNWEANMIRSIVSQFQLDTNGENLINSHMNSSPEGEYQSAVYKTMEDTITGISETLYDIHPIPKYILQSEPHFMYNHDLYTYDENVYEIVKTKNYNRSEQRPLYHYGFNGMGHDFEASNNKIGDFVSRSSIGRAVVSGTLKRYTIHNTYTINEIVISPTFYNKQKGSVMSLVNLTLTYFNDKPTGQPSEGIHSNYIQLGSLVYRYDDPYTGTNKARPGEVYQHHVTRNEEDYFTTYMNYKRSSRQLNDGNGNDGTTKGFVNDEYWQQETPKLNDPPKSPLVPYNVGYNGYSYKYFNNIVETVQKVVKEISLNLQRYEHITENNPLNKFLILTSLVRIMNEKQIQEVAESLYNNGINESKSPWHIYHYAVAQAGTGPALLSIEHWVKTKKITDQEAADLVSTLAFSTRVPTHEYMRHFYTFVTNPDYKYINYLNQTGMLAYTELVHHVYVNHDDSHNKFAVHSFGSFSQHGEEFVTTELIPYLTNQLHLAIEKGNTEHIHFYIRALGNVGHPHILKAFEPYLEGTKYATKFQRLMMVVSFDQIVKVYPKVARSVLYKIYQNIGEVPELRVAAVYQLMRTVPPVEMLQRMAEYTNVDTNDQVNAAVKSTIESAAELEGEDYVALREAAQTAKPLLTHKYYGYQYSQNYLHSYVVRDFEYYYKQTISLWNNPDSIYPNGFKYTLRENVGGVKQHIVTMQTMVSSIKELANLFTQHSGKYYTQQQQQQQQKQHYGENKWTAGYISNLLNVKDHFKDQIEGFFYVKMRCWQKLFSYDNQTIHDLVRVFSEFEDSMQNGKKFDYSKIMVDKATVFSYPTETGLPFIYTYDEPSYVTYNGDINFKAQPQVFTQSNYLYNTPNSFNMTYLVHGTYYWKVQSQLGFVTPFDQQRYSAGYEKNFKIHVPFKGNLFVDFNNKQIETEFEPLELKEYNIFHYSTWPFTYMGEIFNTNPTHRIIKPKDIRNVDTHLGYKETGIDFHVHMAGNMEWLRNFANFFYYYHHDDFISKYFGPLFYDNIEYSEININGQTKASTTTKVTARFNYNYGYTSQPEKTTETTGDMSGHFSKQHIKTPEERQVYFMKMVRGNLYNVHFYYIDSYIQFHGLNTINYHMAGGYAKSNDYPKSKFLFVMQKNNENQDKLYTVGLYVKTTKPNTNGLDFKYAVDFNPDATININLAFGEDYQTSSKLSADIYYHKTQERKNYIKSLPTYHECVKNMGHYPIFAQCANLLVYANYYDRTNFNIKYENIDNYYLNQSYKFYSVFHHMFYNHFTEDYLKGHGKDEVHIEVQYSHDLSYLDGYIHTKNSYMTIEDIRMNNFARQIFVDHPVFHLRSRLMGSFYGYDIYRPYCIAGQYGLRTFDNNTYPVYYGKHWYVFFHYFAPYEHTYYGHPQYNYQQDGPYESYVVYVRKDEKGHKEVKIVFNNPEYYYGKVNTVLMMVHDLKVQVYYNGKEVQYNDDYYNGHVQIYDLPNNEVKFEIVDNFYVIYDGEQVKLTIVDNDKFRDSVRGLCGNYDGEDENDYVSPSNCYFTSYYDFVKSYTVYEKPQQRQEPTTGQQYTSEPTVQHTTNVYDNTQQNYYGKCYKMYYTYVDVISHTDVGSTSEEHFYSDVCTKHQTRYFNENGEICFTIRPMPVCKKNCQQQGTVTQTVPVHCVQKSNVTDLLKKQIDKGGSPDFSKKTQTKIIRVETPQRCYKQ